VPRQELVHIRLTPLAGARLIVQVRQHRVHDGEVGHGRRLIDLSQGFDVTAPEFELVDWSEVTFHLLDQSALPHAGTGRSLVGLVLATQEEHHAEPTSCSGDLPAPGRASHLLDHLVHHEGGVGQRGRRLGEPGTVGHQPGGTIDQASGAGSTMNGWVSSRCCNHCSKDGRVRVRGSGVRRWRGRGWGLFFFGT